MAGFRPEFSGKPSSGLQVQSVTTRDVVGSAAAIVVAMIQRTPDFDMRDENDREMVVAAMRRVIPELVSAVNQGVLRAVEDIQDTGPGGA